MPYEYEDRPNGLFVRDVELMTTLAMNDRSELKRLGMDIDIPWFEKTIVNFKARRAMGRRPQLYRGHNTKTKAAPVIGRLDNLRINDSNWLTADILVTDPEVAEKFRRGEMTNRSAEFSPGLNYLKGLSLLDGHEGHFDSRLPELVLEELTLKKAEGDEEILFVTLNRPIELKEETMALSTEDIAMLRTLIQEELVSLMKEGAEVAPETAAEPELEGETEGSGHLEGEKIEEEVSLKLKAIKDDAESKVAAMARKQEIDTYIVALKAEDNVFTDRQLRKMFEEMETAEGRKEKFKRLKLLTPIDIKLEIEAEYTTPSVEVQLREEYQANEESWKVKGVTEDDYVRLTADTTKDLK